MHRRTFFALWLGCMQLRYVTRHTCCIICETPIPQERLGVLYCHKQLPLMTYDCFCNNCALLILQSRSWNLAKQYVIQSHNTSHQSTCWFIAPCALISCGNLSWIYSRSVKGFIVCWWVASTYSSGEGSWGCAPKCWHTQTTCFRRKACWVNELDTYMCLPLLVLCQRCSATYVWPVYVWFVPVCCQSILSVILSEWYSQEAKFSWLCDSIYICYHRVKNVVNLMSVVTFKVKACTCTIQNCLQTMLCTPIAV